jgi:hypothetical protein
MSSTLKKMLSRGLALLLLAGGLSAAEKPMEVKVKAGDLKGTVTNAVGKTVESVALTLSKGDKVVANAATDVNGVYTFKNLPAGEYALSVAEVMNFTLSVRADGTVSNLKIVLPEGYSAAQGEGTPPVGGGLAGGAGGAGGGGLGLGGALGIAGAGGLAAVGLSELGDNNKDSEEPGSKR